MYGGDVFLTWAQVRIVILWIIPMILLAAMLAVGIGLLLGVFNVFLRDVGQIVPISLQLFFLVYADSLPNLDNSRAISSLDGIQPLLLCC